MRRLLLIACAAIVASTPGVLAQQPPAAKAPAPAAAAAPAGQPPAAAAAAPAAPGPPEAEAFTYNADGRRDPFTNLVGSGAADNRGGSRRADGPSGLSVNEVSVRGIMQSRGALVAMVQGPDNKTYIMRQGDKFTDGSIKSVTPTGLIIIQEVNDPLSLVKQREVSKLLRSLEGGK